MKVLFVLLLFSLKLYSQDIDYLKSQDTLYFVLEESDDNFVLKQNDITYIVYGNYITHMYQFSDSTKGIIFFDTFNNDQILGKSNIEVKRKHFFKKNKARIIDFDFIVKNGLRASFKDILDGPKRKIIYIINSRDLKKRKLTLKKTIISNGSYGQI